MILQIAQWSRKPTCKSASLRNWHIQVNLSRDGAIDVMKEYFEEIGGRPEPPEPKGQKRKGRQSIVKREPETPASTTTTTTKRVKQEKQWTPPPGSWEHEVSHIDTVEENLNPKTGERQRFAYLVWNNQRKTQHPLKHVYQKCPQKVRFPSTKRIGSALTIGQMLLYYESHLVFTPTKDEGSVDDDQGNNIMMQDAY